jgi:hypothetical protein
MRMHVSPFSFQARVQAFAQAALQVEHEQSRAVSSQPRPVVEHDFPNDPIHHARTRSKLRSVVQRILLGTQPTPLPHIGPESIRTSSDPLGSSSGRITQATPPASPRRQNTGTLQSDYPDSPAQTPTTILQYTQSESEHSHLLRRKDM